MTSIIQYIFGSARAIAMQLSHPRSRDFAYQALPCPGVQRSSLQCTLAGGEPSLAEPRLLTGRKGVASLPVRRRGSARRATTSLAYLGPQILLVCRSRESSNGCIYTSFHILAVGRHGARGGSVYRTRYPYPRGSTHIIT